MCCQIEPTYGIPQDLLMSTIKHFSKQSAQAVKVESISPLAPFSLLVKVVSANFDPCIF